MTTSSDETPRAQKKSSGQYTIKTEFDRLRRLVKEADIQDIKKANTVLEKVLQTPVTLNKGDDVATSKATIQLL